MSNVVDIKQGVKKEYNHLISDETAMAIAMDIASFPSLSPHQFDVWEKINEGMSDSKVSQWLKAEKNIDMNRIRIGDFRKQIVNKWGLLSKDFSEDFTEAVKGKARIASMPRINAFDAFNTMANFAQMVMLDNIDAYRTAQKSAGMTLAQRKGQPMIDIELLKNDSVKRFKDAAIIGTNAMNNMKKLLGDEDLDFIDEFNGDVDDADIQRTLDRLEEAKQRAANMAQRA